MCCLGRGADKHVFVKLHFSFRENSSVFGLNIDAIDLIALLTAPIVAFYVAITKNLYEKGADECQASPVTS